MWDAYWENTKFHLIYISPLVLCQTSKVFISQWVSQTWFSETFENVSYNLKQGIFWVLGYIFKCLLYTTKLLGGILVSFHLSVCPSVCPSVRPTSRVRSLAPTVLVESISYLYILSNNFRRCVACEVYCKILKFYFDFVLFWLGMWITCMGNHGVAGGISERRLSICSSSIYLNIKGAF